MATQTAQPKACGGCGGALPVPRSNRQKWCSSCSVREQSAAARRRTRQWIADDPERARSKRADYRAQNRARLRAYQGDYRMRFPDHARSWKDSHPERVRLHTQRANARRDKEVAHANGAARRARKAQAFVERVFRSVLWKQHHGLCGICHTPVPIELMHVDHVVPLARGGAHSYANTQPAHPRCNLRKGASLPEEMKHVA